MKNSTNSVTMTSHDDHLFWQENTIFEILTLTHLSFRFFSTKTKFDRKPNISSEERGFNSAFECVKVSKKEGGQRGEKCVRTRKTRVIIA